MKQRPVALHLRTRIEELKAIRDEINLDLHLATMDLRKEWKQLEGKLPDAEAAAHLKEATGEALEHLAGELRRFRARLRNTAGPRTAARLMGPAVTCRAHDSLADAVRLMWERDVGFLPVTDDHHRLVGVITDRDACMAAWTRGARMNDLLVQSVMTSEVSECREKEDLEGALALMRSRQVRRLPVTNDDRKVVGVVSLNDVARVVAGGAEEIDAPTVVQTLAAITRPSTDAGN